MRSDLNADFIAQLEAEAAFMVVAGKFEFGANTYRWCDGTIPFYLDGEKYTPAGLRIDSVEAEGGVSMMRAGLSIPNADDAIGSVLLGNDCREDPVHLYWAALTIEGEITASGAGYGKFFFGELEDWEIDYNTDIATLECVNELIHWQSNTLLKSEATCPWPFKGDQCGYTGSGSYCDQTWERCTALGNTDNFGGDLYLPEISEKQIWWGKGVR